MRAAREQRPPALPAEPKLERELSEGLLEEEPGRYASGEADAVSGLLFRGVFPGLDFEEASFEGCVFEGMRLTGADLSKTGLTDLVFRRCDLSNASFSKAALTRVRFDDCKLVGADFSEGVLRDVRFSRCSRGTRSFSRRGCARCGSRGATSRARRCRS